MLFRSCKEKEIFHRDNDFIGIGGGWGLQRFRFDSLFRNDGGSFYEKCFAAVGGKTVLDEVEKTRMTISIAIAEGIMEELTVR